MAGHNKWAQIKHKKAVTDAQKSRVFTKLVKLIKVEARLANGDMNSPSLKAAVERARKENMPKDNIDRAIKSASESNPDEKVIYEAYGPGGCALIIEGLTDSKNRTSQEIKHLLSKLGSAFAAPGSALWAFEKTSDGYSPTTSVPLSEEDGTKLAEVLEALEENPDVQEVYVNASF